MQQALSRRASSCRPEACRAGARKAMVLRAALQDNCAAPQSGSSTSSSRRGVLLGLGVALLGVAPGAQAATNTLADLTMPLAAGFDSNGDGLLSVDEVRGAMQRVMGVTVPRERVVRDVMAPVDFNDDGDLSVEEFARGMSLDVAVDERWMRMVERDMQRGVSLRELEAALGDLGQRGRDVLPVAFNMADADRDGVLSQAEAQQAMRLIAAGVLGDL